jgi:hypothetical protein
MSNPKENVMKKPRRLAILAVVLIAGLGLTATATPASAAPCATCPITPKPPIASLRCGYYADFYVDVKVSTPYIDYPLPNYPVLHAFQLTVPGNQQDSIFSYVQAGGVPSLRGERVFPNLRITPRQAVDLVILPETPEGYGFGEVFRRYVDLTRSTTVTGAALTKVQPYPATYFAEIEINTSQITAARYHC